MNDPKNGLFVCGFACVERKNDASKLREEYTASNWICWFALSSFSRRARISYGIPP